MCEFQSTEYAGKHIILELYGVKDVKMLTDINILKSVLVTSAKMANATVLHEHFHHFGEGYGVTGTIILAESHITIHTWPERKYAAIDIFMCGKANPKLASDYIVKNFEPKTHSVQTIYRGTETMET